MSRQTGRHRRPSRSATASRALAVSGAGAAFGVAQAVAVPAAHADIFSQIRGCESGGNYSTNTGNGYYGAYQFSADTWHSLGYSGLPSSASAATQDAAARQLMARSGAGQWPVCSRGYSGGGSGGGYSSGYTSHSYSGYSSSGGSSGGDSQAAGSAPAAPAMRPYVKSSYKPHPAPRFPRHALSTAMVGKRYAEVKAWQAQMAVRGWTITADGYFGPQSQRVAQLFQQEKHIKDPVGVVGLRTWRAAWEVPVS